MTVKEEDEIEHIVSATTHDNILFFTNKGKVYGSKVWEIPESSRTSKGQAVVNIINIEQDEKIMSILPFKEAQENEFFIMATKKGIVKKTKVGEFKNMRASGIIAIRLDKDDLLVSVDKTTGSDNILLVTKKGMAIRFSERDVRPMGRPTSGMRGIKLDAGDEVIGMDIFNPNPPKSKTKEERHSETY